MKILSILLLSVFSVYSQVNFSDSIDYRLEVLPQTDRTNFDITVKYKAGKEATITLPPGCYGTPNLYRYVVKFEGRDGTRVANAEKKTEKIVTPNKNGNVSLRYVLSFDPKQIENSAFAPKIHPEFFSMAGCQWLLQIGEYREKRDFSFEIVNAPKDWKLHSSIAESARKIKTRASYRDLISARIGGGGDSRTFYIKNKPISVSIKGNFDIPNQKIFEAVEKIVRIQRDWFEDYEQPFYQVVINERKSVVAGTAVKNQFVCFVNAEVDEVELNMILAHEMFHNWLPLKMEIKRSTADRQVRHEWFSEGFTEYFAKRLLFDAGLLSPKQFSDLINRDIHNLADNPHKHITYKQLLALANARKFTSSHKKLSYYRGVLIALKWETHLRRSNTDLSEFVRRLYEYFAEKDGAITEDEFFEFAVKYGIDARTDFAEYILEGKPIDVSPNFLGKSFNSKEIEVPSFELGFSLRESQKAGKIIGVIKNGPAYKAGLRNGMEFVRAENAWRFSNAFDPDKRTTVTINRSGKESEFAYFPRGNSIKIVSFMPK